MKLKMTSDNMAGNTARVWLDDFEVSNYCTSIAVHADGQSPITAKIELYVSSLELDLPALVEVLDISPQVDLDNAI